MSHFNRPRTHKESRSAVCGVCFKKQGLRPVTSNQLEQLRNLVDREYSLENTSYPNVLCKSCALALSLYTACPEKPGRKLLKPRYKNIRPPPPETRATADQPCPCTVCEIASCKILPGQLHGGKTFLPEKYWAIIFPDEPYTGPNQSTTAPYSVESRCSICHSVIGKGRSHKCSKTQMQNNLLQLVKQKSLKSNEKIGGNVLKNIFDEKLVTRRGGTVFLSTVAKKLPVTLSLKLNKPRFSLERLQVVKGDSDRGIKKFAMAIRHVFGFKSVEPGLAGSLTKRNKSLEELFEIIDFE